MNKLSWVCVLSLSVFALAGRASAAEPQKRAPLRPALLEGKRAPLFPTNGRTNQVQLSRYDQVMTVVRTRSEGMRYATFSAEPQLVEPGAVIVFEIRSIGSAGELTRWRCIARRDVAECLGTPVHLKYLSDDDRMVLTARVRPAVLAPSPTLDAS